jgi:hypothetical protein
MTDPESTDISDFYAQHLLVLAEAVLDLKVRNEKQEMRLEKLEAERTRITMWRGIAGVITALSGLAVVLTFLLQFVFR